MDTNTGVASASWIELTGVRTQRQRKRAACRQKEQHLRALDRERRRLWRAIRELPMVPLDPPVQKGWIRTFVLNDDQQALPQADLYRSILPKINTVQWNWRADFKVRRRLGGRKVYVLLPQLLKELHPWEFRHLGFTDEECALFFAEHRLDHKGRIYTVYLFNEPWRFSLQVLPNIIDKERQHDAGLQSALRRLDDRLERNALEGPLSNLLGNRHYYREWADPKQRGINPLKNRSLAQVLTALAAEKFEE
ncbi:MAG: hypothetical protein EOO08_13925 [Chitinophagaceae bacterium]|nr:MAG: hypothetical protein EOO08_13925 [Chitinophagaceae bacterium]